jgi:hypothetical protein
MLAKSNSRTTSARQGKGFMIGGIALILVAVGIIISDVNRYRTADANTQSGANTVEIVVYGESETPTPPTTPDVPDTGVLGRLRSDYGEGAKGGIIIMMLAIGVLGLIYVKYNKNERRTFSKPAPTSDIKFL